MAILIHCDFCYVQIRDELVWTYDIVPFSFPPQDGTRGYDDDGHWGACEDCHRLIEADDWAAIMKRSIAGDPTAGRIPAALRWKERLFEYFRSAVRIRPPYQGPPTIEPIDGQHRHGGSI